MPKLSLSDMHRLRYMLAHEAEAYLADLGVTGEELEELRPLIGRSLIQPPNTQEYTSPIAQEAVTAVRAGLPNYPRRLMMATLWLLGGSHNKIARLLGVTNQTVFIQIDKTLPTGQARHSMRLGADISPEHIEWYFNQWLANANVLGAMTDPLAMAQWLHDNHPYNG